MRKRNLNESKQEVPQASTSGSPPKKPKQQEDPDASEKEGETKEQKELLDTSVDTDVEMKDVSEEVVRLPAF